MKTITIFTPTYNRGHLLEKLYESLIKQTYMDFEWLIVDDGSTDNTKEKVQTWIREEKIHITYIYQENGGKMRAHNTGVRSAQTELFMCVDSDDFIVETSVELIINVWKKQKKNFTSGIIAYKGKNSIRRISNSEFPSENNITLSDLYKKGFKGDTTLIYRTDLLKKHLFPEIEGEKFITERYIYNQIDQDYKLIILNQIITICNYIEDGYTNNKIKLLKDNPKGWALYYNQNAKYACSIKNKFYNTCKYISHCLLAGDKNYIINAEYPLLALIALPFGIYLMRKRIRQFENITV